MEFNFKSEISRSIFSSKYMLPMDKTFDDSLKRVLDVVDLYYPEVTKELKEYAINKWVGFGGGFWRVAMNPNKNVSGVNCTTIGQIDDTLESIAEAWYWWAKFSAYGQGEGIDLSKLRPRGSKVHNSSNSSTGAVSFMYTFDGILSVIAQQGRRGASLISLNISHPDIPEFIHCKDKDGVLETANISIQTTDKFMEAVINDADWDFVYENKYEKIVKTTKARLLFKEIAEHAWKSGDPGLQFIDIMKKYSNSDYLGHPVESTNACFDGNMKILTKYGYKTFKELDGLIVPILSDDGQYQMGRVFSNGIKKTIKLVTSNKNSLIVTPDQDIKTLEGIFEAKDSLGKKILTFNPDYVNTSFDSDWVKLGFIQGDGGIGRFKEDSRHKGFELYIGDKDGDVKFLFSDETRGVEYKKTKRTYYITDDKIKENLVKYSFDFSPLYERELPKNIPEEKECSFLRGLFSANGYVTTKYRVGLKATSKQLINGVSDLLNKYGINHYITTNKTKKINFPNGEYRVKESYDINISTLEGLLKYYYFIGFIHNYKNDNLKKLLLSKSPSVKKIIELPEQEIFDFSLPTNHWGFVNGVVVHNCSEQNLDPHNTCLLASMNFAKYHEFKHIFDRVVAVMIYTLDAFRRYEIDDKRSPSPIQIEKLTKLPRIGLGVTGLADLFIQDHIVYGSAESIIIAKTLFGRLSGESYKTSYAIAKSNGKSFEYYDKEKYLQSPFVQRLLSEGWIEDYHLDMQAHVCKTTIAPNGSLSFIVECGGSGIEPIFGKYYVRRERATTNEWKEWFTYNQAVINHLDSLGVEVTKENVEKYCSDPWWATAHKVNNHDKIKLIAEIQKYIDSAISVTYNLKSNSTPSQIEEIYMDAWKNELKGVTVYREGSKAGVMITEENYESSKSLEQQTNSNRFSPTRPEIVPCDIYESTVDKVRHVVLVGIVEGKPYEIFATNDPEHRIDLQKYKKGYIQKVSKGKYNLIVDNVQKTVLAEIDKMFDEEYGTLSRFISMSMRHSIPIPFIVDQLSKDRKFIGFERSVGRVLKKYIVEGDEVLTNDKCPECGGKLIYQGGCKICSVCGNGKCD